MANFTVEGQVQLDGGEEVSRDLKLQAHVFDPGGRFLGTADVDPQGHFKTEISLARPTPIEIVVGPPGEPTAIRRSSAPRQRFNEREWVNTGERRFNLKPKLRIAPGLLNILFPVQICVSGHIRKVVTRNGNTEYCPIPYLKVEVFDVDRESCWWPYLSTHWDQLLDKRVVLASDLIKTAGASQRALQAAEPTSPRFEEASAGPVATDLFRVGEMKTLKESIASRVQDLTIVSRLAPWIYLSRCFYSQSVVCEAFTDADGFFSCCFPWWLFHVRRGRLRVDSRPDIIIRVTQVINGVETVLYMDPYTSTRWNVTSTHIDLFLEDEAIVCGGGDSDPLPGTSTASILQIGADPVWLVNQANGRYTTPPYSNGAYGGNLYIRGNFSADLLSGSPKRYYKLSYAKDGTNDFKPVKTTLSALRSVTLGTFETYVLGPQPDGTPLAGLYETQDTAHWWLMPGATGGSGMVLGLWDTSFEDDQGLYVLRLEVFDEAGNKITTMQFAKHAGNGTGTDPNPVPIVTDHLDLKFHIDNKPLEFHLDTPATNDCGVIPWSPSLNLQVHVHAEQENGRVNSWNLHYVKGINPNQIPLGSNQYFAGQGVVDEDINANALLHEPVTLTNPLGELQSTCAFALVLKAWLHVRNNSGFAYAGEKVYAIAIERCSRP